MFVFTAKLNKRKVVIIVLALAVLRAYYTDSGRYQPKFNKSAKSSAVILKTNEDRVAF